MSACEDHVSSVLDEIALEGLDGITLEGLWIRLADRPYFQDVIDNYIKHYVWNIIKCLQEVEIFLLPEARPPLKIFDRYDFVDPELGMILEPDVLPVDIYPYHPIEDAEKEIKGSCKTYETRIPAPPEVFKLSVTEVESMYGSKLVVVASQEARVKALISCEADPELELNKIQYCLLERIGRSRYLGEVTQGKVSLQMVVDDPKALFYHRKFLLNHGLVTKQVHHQKSGSHNCSGSLLHLPRFFVERRPKVLYLTERVVELLKTRDNYMADYEMIRKELALTSSLKKLFQTQCFQRFVRTDLKLPYRALYPDAKQSEWRLKGRDREKQIRVLQLLDPNADVLAVSSREDDLDLGDDDDISDNLGPMNEFKMAMNVSYLSQVHDCVEKSGPEGLSQVEISQKMGLPKLNSRTVSRNLLKKEMASVYMNDVGRQRVTRFKCKNFGRRHEATSEPSVNDENNPTFMLARSAASQDELSDYREKKSRSKRKGESGGRYDASRKKLKLDIAEDDPTKFDVYEIVKTEPLDVYDEESVENGGGSSVSSPRSGSPESVGMSEESLPSSQTETGTSESYDLSGTGYVVINKKLHNQINRSRFAHHSKETPNMTYRIYKRINMILDYVRVHKVVDDYSKLVKLINTEEEKEGSTMKIDRKSLFRLIFRLNTEGYLNIFSYLLTNGTKEKTFFFICDTTITMNHSAIQSEIEQAKMKMVIVNRENMDTQVKTDNPNDESIEQSAEELKAISASTKKISFVYDKKVGRKYGLSPKFVRMKILHQFLFYLIYDYQGREDLDQEECARYYVETQTEMDEALAGDLPHVYHKEVSWKMFIPPLRKHTGWPEGWTVMSDILLRLPLSLFVKIFNVTFVVPNFEYWLNHPIRKHLLLKHLPVNVRHCLTAARKYIFSIYEVLQLLCYVGLLQFGPQRFKEKDQVLFFLNRRTTLLNTVSSKPGYHQISDEIYDQHNFEFSGAADVDKYWYDLWNICLHTRLGGRMCVQGKDIVLEALQTKPAMISAVTPRQADEAQKLDTGFVPGDQKGAAGLDSALFSHLKRNWNWSTANLSATRPPLALASKAVDKRKARLASVKCDPVVFNKYSVVVKKSINYLHSGKFFRTGKSEKKPIPMKNPNKKIAPPKKLLSKRRNVIRTVQARKKSKHRQRPYYDDVDLDALRLMSKLRVDWSPEEDNLLLICKVASIYLCPNPRQQIIGFHVVRDILHEAIPSSTNKTSRACQRRILYVMKNHTTFNNLALHLEEVKQDPDIHKRFGNALAELKRTCDCSTNLEDALNEKFKLLVSELRSRSQGLISESPVRKWRIPDDPKTFWEEYEITEPKNTLKLKGHFQDVKNVSDVYCAVLNAVIISSMCCPSDKTSWSYQLFKVYQQYPDSMLRSTMAKLRADQMVSLKKSYIPLVQKSNYIPLSSSPYQLSASYLHLIQTKYQYRIFQEGFLTMEKVIREAVQEQGMQAVITDGGSTAALVELMERNQITFRVDIPDQVIILDPRISEKDETYARIIERYRDLLQNYKPGSEITSSALFKRNEDKSNDGNSKGDKSFTEDEDIEAEFDSACPIEDVNLNGSPSPLYPPGSQQTVVARTACRIALFMMREVLEDSASVGNNQHAHDFFVVNSCQIYIQLSESQSTVMPLSKQDISVALDFMKQKMIVDNSSACEELVHEKLNELEASDEDKQVAKQILSYTLRKKEIGATIEEIRVNFFPQCRGMSLAQVLDVLVSTNMLLRTGVTTVHYVHKNFAHHWLIHTYKLLRLSREKLEPSSVKAIHLGPRDENVDVLNDGTSTDTPPDLNNYSEDELESTSDNQSNPDYEQDKIISDEAMEIEDVQNEMKICETDHSNVSISNITNESVSQPITPAEENEALPESKEKESEIIEEAGEDVAKEQDMHAEQGGAQDEKEANRTEVSEESVDTVHSEKDSGVQTRERNVNASLPSDSGMDTTEIPTTATDSEEPQYFCKECDLLRSNPERKKRVRKPEGSRRGSTFGNCTSCGKRTLIYQSGKKAVIQSGNMQEFIEKIQFNDSEKIQVAIRPWVRVNGSLNRRVLDRLLGSVLSHAMFKPNVSLKDLSQRFCPALQPYQVRELVEMLQKLGCVKMIAVKKSHKATLFSEPSRIRLEPADGTEDESTITVEPQRDAVLRLGQFIGHKAYAQDFLTC